MTLQEIKQAIADGSNVYWSNTGYRVLRAVNGNYNIICTSNDHCIGLTWLDGVTLNGKEIDFFIE
jgi:hypothetical protein